MASNEAQQNSENKQVRWTGISIGNDTKIQVTNPSVAVPSGLHVVHSFISEEESQSLLEEIDKNEFVREGFEQRRLVQRYSIANSDEAETPNSLLRLAERVEDVTGKSPKTISVEEYPRNQLMKQFNPFIRTTVTTFESSVRCKCRDGDCGCFVAVIPLTASYIEKTNRPKRRTVDCWDLHSPNHITGLMFDQRSLFVKKDEVLWEWRSRVSAAGPDCKESDRIVLLKFQSLCVPVSAKGGIADSNFGYVPKPEDLLPRNEKMPPLEDLLTIVVTTSPIKSNPSTELFERVFQTFEHGGHTFAYKCKKVIICDGCRQKDQNTRKLGNTKQAMRNGIVDAGQFDNYVEFKKNLKNLCAAATEESPFFNSRVEELDMRHGYGFALRHAVRECVPTPYVIVIQHDRTFMRPTPIAETVHAMWAHRNIKYVGMSMRSNLIYRDQFLGKYGRTYIDGMKQCILRPSELALDSKMYGPNSMSTEKMEYGGQEKLRENIAALAETYRGSQHLADELEWNRLNPPEEGKCQLSLTPTFFWYDNVHICETAHYRDFVFHEPYKMVVRGGFVEDKLSPVIKKTVERLGLVEGHSRFGCFLLDDHSGMFFTGHLDGGSYLTMAEKKAISGGSNRGV